MGVTSAKGINKTKLHSDSLHCMHDVFLVLPSTLKKIKLKETFVTTKNYAVFLKLRDFKVAV